MLVGRKEVRTRSQKKNGQQCRSSRILADCFLEHRGKSVVSHGIAGDYVCRRKCQMRSFVACHLEYHKRKAQLENDLQCDETAECVVIALFRRRKEARNQSDRNQSRSAGPATGKDGEGYRSVNSQPRAQGVPGVLLLRCEPSPGACGFEILGHSGCVDLGDRIAFN